MSSCTFTVSLDELRQVGTTLSRSASELAAFADIRDDYDPILGSNEVRHEVHAFFQHWSDGIVRISDHVQELANHLMTAVDAYTETENKLIANATPAQ